MALVLNELLANAERHGEPGSARLEVATDAEGAWLRFFSEGALPDSFDFEHLPAGATGLGLVKSLLPRRGAHRGFSVPAPRTVLAELHLTPPALQRGREPGRWVKTAEMAR